MKFFLYLFYSFFLYFIYIDGRYAVGISSGFNTGAGISGTSSKNFLYGDLNPANFAYVPDYAIGLYILPVNQTSPFDPQKFPLSYTNIFVVGPIPTLKNTGLFGEIISSFADNQIRIVGTSGGIGYEVVPNLSIGIYGSYKKINSIEYLSGSIGVLYSIPFKYKLFWDIGFFDFTYGASYSSANSQIQNGIFRYDIGYLLPGFTFQFIKNKYFKAYYQATIPIKANFTVITAINGFRFNILDTIDAFFGFSGDDFFKITTPYIGLDIQVPLSVATLHSSISYSISNSRPEISLGGYAQFHISKLIIPRNHTDKRLISILTPEKYFTPNADLHDDILTISLRHPDIKFVKDWSLVVVDSFEKVVLVMNANILKRNNLGYYDFPKEITWAGLDYKAEVVPDGNYCFKLLMVTTDNIKKYWTVGCTTLDSNPPLFKAEIKDSFIHVTDGDVLRILLSSISDDIDTYLIKVMTREGELIYSEVVKNPSKLKQFNYEWNPKANNKLKEGTYSVSIEAIDWAKNKTKEELHGITFYTNKTYVQIKVVDNVFSPNGDLNKDTIGFLLNVLDPKIKIVAWSVTIYSSQTKGIVKQFRANTPFVPSTVFWNGISSNNQLCPSGNYYVVFDIYDKFSNQHTSLPRPILLDNDPPVLSIEVPDIMLTPDGDNIHDFVKIRLHAIDLSHIIAYKLKILDKENTVIKNISAKSSAPNLIKWDGTDSRGVRVDNLETITFAFSAIDEGGNIGIADKGSLKTGITIESLSKSLQREREIIIRFPNIQYALNSPEPTKQSQEVYLNELLTFFMTMKQKYPKLHIKIVGHADTSGSDEINDPLSLERANFILNYLIKKGANNSFFHAEGKGSKQILYSEIDEFFQSKNRRIEFILTIVE